MLDARNRPLLTVLFLFVALYACAREEGEPQAEAADTTLTDPTSVTTNNASVLNNSDTATWTAGLTAMPVDRANPDAAARIRRPRRDSGDAR
jgi:hypothetical protein